MGYIEGENRNQIILFPESIDEYISDNNAIRIIDEYIQQLDLESLGFKRAATPLTLEDWSSPDNLDTQLRYSDQLFIFFRTVIADR